MSCAEGGFGRSQVPSGASTGRYEVLERRDGGERFDGRGVLDAVEAVRGEIAAAVRGMQADQQWAVDARLRELDPTPQKSRLGGNATLGVSLAVAHAAAAALDIPLVEHLHQLWQRAVSQATTSDPACESSPQAAPHQLRADGSSETAASAMSMPVPMVNMISGGLHAGGNLEVQDFLILPVGAGCFREALEWAVRIRHRLGRLLDRSGYEGRLTADEGGFGPRLPGHRSALEFLMRAVEAAGLRPGRDVFFGLDVAATHFCRDGMYHFRDADKMRLSSEQLVALLASWCDEFPILSLEDALAEDDESGWCRLTEQLGPRLQLIGDDLFVTNRLRLQRGIENGLGNAILVKPNQVGTLWETFETVCAARKAGYRTIVSARSGETEDISIAPLAVAIGAGQIKIGSVAHGERLVKYNELLRLEERLGARAPFAGRLPFTDFTALAD